MSVGRICSRRVLIARPHEDAYQAARRMAEHDTGTVVVLGEENQPVGVLTDRDITVRCVAQGHDPNKMPVAELMSSPAISVSESCPIDDAVMRMTQSVTRRLVVTSDGDPRKLVGILSMDDIMALLAEESRLIGDLLKKQEPVL